MRSTSKPLLTRQPKQRTKPPASAPDSTASTILAYLIFFCSCVIIAVLCELNRYPWNQNMLLQNITAATFCVYAAALYVTYMLITASLKCVLKYAEQVAHHHKWGMHYQQSPYHYEEHEEQEEEEMQESDSSDSDSEEARNKTTSFKMRPLWRSGGKGTDAASCGIPTELEEHVEEGNQIKHKDGHQEAHGNASLSDVSGDDPSGSSSFMHHHRSSVSSHFLKQELPKTKGQNIQDHISSFFGFDKKKKARRVHEAEDLEIQDELGKEDEEEDEQDSDSENRRLNFFYNNFMLKYFQEQSRLRQRLPRSVIISSMYLGGSGAFLAIAPLCMWDFTMSASFAASLLFISIVDAKKVDSEFKPDVDTAGTIRKIKWMRWSFHACALVSVFLILWLDTREEIEYYAVPIIESVESSLYPIVQIAPSPSTPLAPNTSFREGTVPFKTQGTLIFEGRTGLAYKWPLIILSASSPIFLRAGGGGVSKFYYSLPPSQTLETGLPVSTILAILVLCWHNSSELIMRDIQSMIDFKTALPMFLVCPLCVAAALAFVLYGFKRRSSGIISVVLLLIMCVRQQISAKHRLQSRLDWMALLNTVHSMFLVGVYMWYKHKVQIPDHQRHTWSRKPLLKKNKTQPVRRTSIPPSDSNFMIESEESEPPAKTQVTNHDI